MSGNHDARCERVYTDSGFVFIDCLCNMRAAQAKAWDEGWNACVDVICDPYEIPDDKWRENPYRDAPTTAGEGERGEG